MWNLLPFGFCKQNVCLPGVAQANKDEEQDTNPVVAQPVLPWNNAQSLTASDATASMAGQQRQQQQQQNLFQDCSLCQREDLRDVFVGCGGRAPDSGHLLHEALSGFVRTMLRGVCIEVMLDDGTTLFPEASLNYELTHLTLEVNDVRRAIILADVEAVATSSELSMRNVPSSLYQHVDERCCTLILRGQEFVTFRFDSTRHREYFSACLALLVARKESAGDLRLKTT
mmetsp:Transcript_25967/g.49744  ORF Transcript_25967/g.49744 Transcript_25967/m.49744 type:complete len:228 (+) Transcript_25967:62-745(+)